MKSLIYLNENFFGYEKEILIELKKKYKVYSLEKNLNFYEKYYVKLFKIFCGKIKSDKIMDNLICKKLKKQLKYLSKEESFDLFCIADYSLSNNQIELLNKELKINKKILYLWDNMDKILNWDKDNEKYKFEKYKGKFNKIFSFDPVDCKNFKYIFRPTFFSIRLEKLETIEYEWSFIGQYSEERLNKIKKIEKMNKSNKFIYLYENPFILLFNIIKGKKIKNYDYIYTRKIDKKNYNQILSKSRLIVDLVNTEQKGLTQRTLDSLFLEKKVITDLKEVKEYDFYNPNNIFIIENFEDFFIPNSFYENPYEKVPENIRKRYSLEQWIEDIFN